MTKAEEIVKGLTKIQRRAVIDGFAWSGHTRLALWKLKLVESLHDGWQKPNKYSAHQYLFTLTPLGLEVRALLKGQDHG